MKKPRADAKLLNLPEAQQAQLAEWLLSGLPYHKARELVEKEFGVAVASLAPFSAFWDEVCRPLLLVRRRRAVEASDEVAKAAAAEPGRFDAATIDALKQKAFELAISPQSDPRDVKGLLMLVLKAKDQDLDEQKLRLEREKFEFDAARRAMEHVEAIRVIQVDGGADAQEKLTRVREALFGVAPE